MSKPAGWVKMHRSITDHWIWTSERHSKQSAWVDLIMMVNHEDRKITIGKKLVTIHKGQVWTSYEKLKERWKWSDDRMSGFIKMLVDDKMIAVQPTNRGTLITVLNYLIYQGSVDQDSEQPGSRPGSGSGTESGTGPGIKSGTNKKNIRMNKNVKKGDAPGPGKYEP